jgi:Uma2 family endonuclease
VVPPDIVVEVISESARDVHRDRIEKPDEYAAFGVHWYWLIDPAARTLEIFELSSERQVVRQLAAASGVVVPRAAKVSRSIWMHFGRKSIGWKAIEELRAAR